MKFKTTKPSKKNDICRFLDSKISQIDNFMDFVKKILNQQFQTVYFPRIYSLNFSDKFCCLMH